MYILTSPRENWVLLNLPVMAFVSEVSYIKPVGKEGWQPLNWIGRVHTRSQKGNSSSSQS